MTTKQDEYKKNQVKRGYQSITRWVPVRDIKRVNKYLAGVTKKFKQGD